MNPRSSFWLQVRAACESAISLPPEEWLSHLVAALGFAPCIDGDQIWFKMHEDQAPDQGGGYRSLPERVGADALTPAQFAEVQELGLLVS